MQRITVITLFALLLAGPAAAQLRTAGGAGAGAGTGSGAGAASSGDGQSTSSSSSTQTTTKDGKTTTVTTRDGKTTTDVKNDEGPWFVTSLTNVQVEVSLTDQMGNQPPEKKTVSMIVSNRYWGKVRSSATVMPPGESPYSVQLNVDARPTVSKEGPIQLELTLEYAPIRTGADPKDKRPTGINQSQTVVLQSGKPLMVAQSADPVSDRKVIVEVKATVLK